MTAPLCKDCRHFQQDGEHSPGYIASFSLCGHPVATQDLGIEPVMGLSLERQRFCESMRGKLQPCGTDGELYEAAP